MDRCIRGGNNLWNKPHQSKLNHISRLTLACPLKAARCLQVSQSDVTFLFYLKLGPFTKEGKSIMCQIARARE
jgi:hypothetical protein